VKVGGEIGENDLEITILEMCFGGFGSYTLGRS
jgi:hypothetical protein